ncbi:MAG: alpha/beta hydrolase [Chiayiivirga sp.]|jgi:pimeloyl-ACP methyl ester carboxylesterase|nr:alpha/beta hydrolase [Chiayiivirga sp.]
MKQWLLLGLAILIVVALALPVLRNRERGPLDAAARAEAPGQFLELTHGAVHVQLDGPESGVPVVLVPGFSVPSYVWEPLDAQLAAAGFRVVRFDLYGRGWSARPDVVYDRDLFAHQLDEVLDALQIERAHVVGLSMGGAIAGRYAAQHPDRVDALVLVAPFTRARDISPLQWPWLGEWLNRVWLLPKLAASQMSDFVHPERHPGWAAKFEPQMRFGGFGRAILSTLRHVMTRDSLDDFDAIGKQSRATLLVWGRQDTVVPFADHEAVRAAIPQAQFLAVDEAGHLPHVEQSAQAGPRIIEFLQRGHRVRAARH